MVAVLVLTLLCSACTSMSRQGHYMVLDRPYPSRSPDCSVELFMEKLPSRPFTKVSRVDVHLEETFFGSPGFQDALSELKKQACLSGADAIIEVRQRRSRVVEAEVYHVTAIGIKYGD
jgi:hypothetical protein